jgi:hypothetical protein
LGGAGIEDGGYLAGESTGILAFFLQQNPENFCCVFLLWEGRASRQLITLRDSGAAGRASGRALRLREAAKFEPLIKCARLPPASGESAMRPWFGVLMALIAAGCSVTLPVVVIGKDGKILRGTTTASLSGGSFNVTDGSLSCGGDYDALDTSPTISIPVLCSDGRRGIVIATRDNNGLSGAGTVRLTDGSEATFMFGRAAAGL